MLLFSLTVPSRTFVLVAKSLRYRLWVCGWGLWWCVASITVLLGPAWWESILLSPPSEVTALGAVRTYALCKVRYTLLALCWPRRRLQIELLRSVGLGDWMSPKTVPSPKFCRWCDEGLKNPIARSRQNFGVRAYTLRCNGALLLRNPTSKSAWILVRVSLSKSKNFLSEAKNYR